MSEQLEEAIREITDSVNLFWRNIKGSNYMSDEMYQMEMKFLDFLIERARAGDAVMNMPANSSLHYRPLNMGDMAMPYIFERPGENTVEAQDPLTALTMHKLPEGGPDGR